MELSQHLQYPIYTAMSITHIHPEILWPLSKWKEGKGKERRPECQSVYSHYSRLKTNLIALAASASALRRTLVSHASSPSNLPPKTFPHCSSMRPSFPWAHCCKGHRVSHDYFRRKIITMEIQIILKREWQKSS